MKTISNLIETIGQCRNANLEIKRIMLNKKMVSIFGAQCFIEIDWKEGMVFGYPAKLGRVKEGFEVVIE